jgi:hypothetical protein
MIHQKILADYKRILGQTLRLGRLLAIQTSYSIMQRCVMCDAEYDAATVERAPKCVCSDRCRKAYRRTRYHARTRRL